MLSVIVIPEINGIAWFRISIALEIEIKICARVENSARVGWGILNRGQRDRGSNNRRSVPETVAVNRDLPGLLVITTDHGCTVPSTTIDTKIFTSPVLDTEEVITSIFEGPLSTC